MRLTADADHGSGIVTATVGADKIDLDVWDAIDFVNEITHALRVANTDPRDAAAEDADDYYRD